MIWFLLCLLLVGCHDRDDCRRVPPDDTSSAESLTLPPFSPSPLAGTATIPEPSPLVLGLVGLAGVVGRGR